MDLSNGKRIMLIGCGCSGKSTTAQWLGKATGLPVVNLDKIFWKSPCVHIPTEDFVAQVRHAAVRDQWIMDGTYYKTFDTDGRLERCDLVIYLDAPRYICIKNALAILFKRESGAGEERPMTVSWSFLRWVWRFNALHRDEILEKVRQVKGPDKLIIIRKRAELEAMLPRPAEQTIGRE